MIEWAVYKDGEDWRIGAPVAHVVLKGESGEDLDAQLSQWRMKRSELTTFESEELRAEFEAAFGPVGDSVDPVQESAEAV